MLRDFLAWVEALPRVTLHGRPHPRTLGPGRHRSRVRMRRGRHRKSPYADSRRLSELMLPGSRIRSDGDSHRRTSPAYVRDPARARAAALVAPARSTHAMGHAGADRQTARRGPGPELPRVGPLRPGQVDLKGRIRPGPAAEILRRGCWVSQSRPTLLGWIRWACSGTVASAPCTRCQARRSEQRRGRRPFGSHLR